MFAHTRALPTTLLPVLAALLACDASPADDHAGAAPPPAGADTTLVVDTGRVVDATGRVMELEAAPRRVVSLVPSVTDLLVALDAQDRLIARTEFDVHPALDSLPSVGQGLTPNLEWIVARSPDLVIAWPDAQGRDVVQRLRDLGIPVYGARLESTTAVLRTTRDLGRLLGLEARADTLTSRLRSGLDSVRASVAALDRPRVLYVTGGDPPYAAGAATFMDELIRIAGGRNLAAPLGTGWLQLSLEEVVRRQPDVVVIPSHGDSARALNRLRDAPGWRELEAVRAGRVAMVDGALFDRPGPRLPEAAARLARAIHGEPR